VVYDESFWSDHKLCFKLLFFNIMLSGMSAIFPRDMRVQDVNIAVNMACSPRLNMRTFSDPRVCFLDFSCSNGRIESENLTLFGIFGHIQSAQFTAF
jgi:hypothetical protein